jgi:hypothetical protein
MFVIAGVANYNDRAKATICEISRKIEHFSFWPSWLCRPELTSGRAANREFEFEIVQRTAFMVFRELSPRVDKVRR